MKKRGIQGGGGPGSLTSGLGGLSWNWIRPILAFSILRGPPALLITGWVRTNPSTSSLSSIVPPTFLIIRMFLRSTLSADFMSIVFITELTAMGPSRFEYCDTILEESDVLAAWRRAAVSVREMGSDMSWSTLTAAAAALWKASDMIEG